MLTGFWPTQPWLERGTARVKCLSQDHNTVSLARARIQTVWSRDKQTNHEASMPLLQYTIEGQIFMFLVVTNNARILPCLQFYIQFQLTVPRCIPFNGVHVCAFIWNGNSVFQVFRILIHFNLLWLCSFMSLVVFLYFLWVLFYYSKFFDKLVSAEISEIKFLGKMLEEIQMVQILFVGWWE